MNYSKINEKQLINDKIAKTNQNKDMTSFWNKISSNKFILPSSFEDEEGDLCITEYWENYFKSVSTDIERSAKSSFKTLDFNHNMIIRVHEIEKAIESLNCGKSSVPDLVFPEHLTCAGRSVYIHLALLYSAIFLCSMISNKLMHVNIIPLIKNKGSNFSSKDNYRLIS